MTSSLLAAALLAAFCGSAVQEDPGTPAAAFESAMLYLSGVSCIEELSQDELERYQSLSEHPLDLNLAGRARLVSTGLFSQYQAASLIDYRSRSDILSFSELGLVDGFSPELAEALKPFVTLRTDSAPGTRRKLRISQSVTAGGSVRSGSQYTAKLKYAAELGDRAEFRWTSRTTYSEPEFRPGTFSAAYYGRRFLGKVVLGHFSARFGQGLALWSGFSMSGYSSAASFRKNGGGIAVTGLRRLSCWASQPTGIFGAFAHDRIFLLRQAHHRQPHMDLQEPDAWRDRHRIGGIGRLAAVAAGCRNLRELCSDYSGRLRGVGGLIWIPEYGRKFALQGGGTTPYTRNTAASRQAGRLSASYAPQMRHTGPTSGRRSTRRSCSSGRSSASGNCCSPRSCAGADGCVRPRSFRCATTFAPTWRRSGGDGRPQEDSTPLVREFRLALVRTGGEGGRSISP